MKLENKHYVSQALTRLKVAGKKSSNGILDFIIGLLVLAITIFFLIIGLIIRVFMIVKPSRF